MVFKRRSECKILGQARWGCDVVERGRDCKAVGRAGMRERVRLKTEPGVLARIIDFMSISELQNGETGRLNIIPK